MKLIISITLSLLISSCVFAQNNNIDEIITRGLVLAEKGKYSEAIKVYEKGLKQEPTNSLLNFNLADALYKTRNYQKAEKAIMNAIIENPEQGSNHLLLSSIMQSKGQRAKSIMSLYYFLLLEPNSIRSENYYNQLIALLNQGVIWETDKKINIKMPVSISDVDFGSADMLISLLAASKYYNENRDKSDLEYFVITNNGFFAILQDLKKEKKGFWWDIYVSKFCNMMESENCEAFSYYISQSGNSSAFDKWKNANSEKNLKFNEWLVINKK